MSKKISSMKNSAPTNFAWTKDSAFTSTQKDGSAAMHKKFMSTVPQAGGLKPLLEKLLESFIGTVNASAGIIRIPSPDDQTLHMISSVGLPTEFLEAENSAPLACEIYSKAPTGSGFYFANLSACKTRPECRYLGCQIQSLIAVPIENHVTPDHPIGMVTLFFNQSQEPHDLIIKTVGVFAHMLSSVIEHDKLNHDAKRADLIAERQAIANEIHDSLAQTLVYARMRTSLLLKSIRAGNEPMVAKYAQDVDEALENSQKTVRELITDFRCAMDPSGLLHALQTLTRQFCHRNEIALEYINRITNLKLPLEYEIQVFRIVQEALTNIATHSQATHARLVVERSGNHCVFTIEDNGSGGCTFIPLEGHYGMMIMRERAQRIGGEIKVESASESGTRVQLFFPEPGENWRTVNE